jgi:NAD(P)H-hydrate repair Nnr-like enzyme with NAD(P)H-hydrate dehydratase domain
MIAAARANRLAGLLANPTPATQVKDIIACIPRALDEIINKR